VTWPVKSVGNGVDHDLGRLAELHERDVGLVDSTSASITDMSATVSSTVPALFMVPTMTFSPSSMLRRVTMPSKGDFEADLRQRVLAAAEAGLLLIELGLAVLDFLLARLEIALTHFDLGLARSSVSRVVKPAAVSSCWRFRPGAPRRVGRARSASRRATARARAGAGDRSDVAAHRGFGVDRIDLQEELAGLDPIAFLDAEVRDAAHRLGADVDGFLRVDLADADTIASRSRFWMVSTVTVVPVSPRRANAPPRRRRTTKAPATIQNHFLRNTSPSLNSRPPITANTAATSRCHAQIDGHQPPPISSRRPPARRREPNAQQPHPPQAEHIDRAEQPRRPRAFVEHAQNPGQVVGTRQRLVGVMHGRCDDLLQREDDRGVHR
jgi:hypothetical protein